MEDGASDSLKTSVFSDLEESKSEKNSAVIKNDTFPSRFRRTVKKYNDKDLVEHNFGIDFTKLQNDEEQWVRLRKILNVNNREMNDHVAKGTAPLFGYPTVLYEQEEQTNDIDRIRQSLMAQIFTRNPDKPSIHTIRQTMRDAQGRPEEL